MNSPVIQLLVLAGIAVFLILRLRSVLGTRTGFEKPPVEGPKAQAERRGARRDFEVIEGGPDRDITDHVPDGSPDAQALAAMKQADPAFNVRDFLDGSRGAYEMILAAFEKGEIEEVRGFLSDEVAETFDQVIADRKARGLSIQAEILGVRETSLRGATFDADDNEAQLTVRYLAEMTSVVRDADDAVVEGSPTAVKRQRDVWTFARQMGSDDPNWTLVATGE